MTSDVLVVGNTRIPYSLRTSSKAKRKRIVVTPESVEVVLPEGTTAADAAAFMHDKRRWVFDKVSDLQSKSPAVAPESLAVANGSKVLWRGRNLTVRVALADVDAPVVVYRSKFEVRLPMATPAAGKAAATKAAIEIWMQDRALSEAKALVGRFAARAGVAARRVEVRPMARLWGSCGQDRVIRLDAGFMRLPAHLAEYLAAHEAAHLVHRDHGAKFWRLLRTLLPDARARHAELVAHGRRRL